MAQDKSIKKGALPNGINYYLAANASCKGKMSLSLVQKMDPTIEASDLGEYARSAFSNLVIGKSSLEQFLARNGMFPSEDGYIHYQPGSIIYSFGEFASERGDAAMDSTIFALVRLADTSLGDTLPSSSVAIVIAGDFNEATLVSKMKTLSIFSSSHQGSIPEYKYVWNPSATDPGIRRTGESPTKIYVQWHDARVPKSFMTTALPVISEKLAGEFGWILKNRLYPAFRSEHIPVWLDFDYKDSTEGLGDNVMTLSVSCARNLADKAESILRRNIDILYTFGIDETEFTYARDAYKFRWIGLSRKSIIPNRALTKRCCAEFLYGASLSTEEERIRFAYRDIPDSSQTRLFNKYIKRILSQNASIDNSLRQPATLLRRSVLSSYFDAYAPKEELKLPKNNDTEYVTGGVIWTFPNGVNVIYKKLDTQGEMHYCYASRGGRQYADPDYFNCIDGVYGENFTNYLAAYGIKMDVNFTPSDVRLQGRVPTQNVERMLTVLAALSNQEENDKVYSPKCYKLLVLVGDMEIADIKSIMGSYVSSLRPGGKWTSASAQFEDTEREDDAKDSFIKECRFPFDASVSNLAISEVALWGLKSAMGRAFSGYGIGSDVKGGFIGFPTNSYHIGIMAEDAPLDNFPDGEKHIASFEKTSIIRATLRNLTSTPIPASELKVFKSLAAGAFEVYRKTPEYFIGTACNRYLNNKDGMNKYPGAINAVSAADLQNFYKKAFEAMH